MECVHMSIKECQKAEVIQKVLCGAWSRRRAALELRISTRQVFRLCSRCREEGIQGLTHKARGKESNRRVSKGMRKKILSQIRQKYHDFGPTFAAEMLLERHGIKVSVSTLRRWMIEEELWTARKRKEMRIFSLRPRRSHAGELVQGDGSYEAWFEDRGPRACLLVLIDDATGRVELRFAEHESVEAYFDIMRRYITRYGRPRALYTDKLNVFKTSPTAAHEENSAQFQRAMKELEIEIIHANTPQAKGRVERANRTLQDRLIKLMRLEGTSSIEEGNVFLERFSSDYNRRFCRAPLLPEDLHRPLSGQFHLDHILVKKERRKVLKDLSVRFQRKVYQLQTREPRRLVGRQVMVSERDGQIVVELEGRVIPYVLFREGALLETPLNGKEVTAYLDKKVYLTRIQQYRRQRRGH